jgi:hypothetical protein
MRAVMSIVVPPDFDRKLSAVVRGWRVPNGWRIPFFVINSLLTTGLDPVVHAEVQQIKAPD